MTSLVVNTNILSLSFQIIEDHWSDLRFQKGVPLVNTPKLSITKETRNIALSCGAKKRVDVLNHFGVDH